MTGPEKKLKDKCEGCGGAADAIGGLEQCSECGETYHSDDCIDDHKADAHPELFEDDGDEW